MSGLRQRIQEWGPWLAPLLVGAFLRFWNLSSQIVGGDELHALRAATSRPLADILFRYEAPDIYMPLAAALHGLASMGVTLTESSLRWPGLLAGLLALVLIPSLAVRFVGKRVALLFAWVLALSPALVLYSRIARSYMPLIVLGTAASLAFLAWFTEGRGRHLAGALGGALGAVFCHPVAVPAVLAPLAFGMLDLQGRAGGARRLHARRWMHAGLGLGLALGVWFWLSREGLLELAHGRREALRFDLDSFLGLAKIQAGATRGIAASVFWILALGGFARLLRANRRFGLYLLVSYLAPIVGLIVLSPVAGDVPLLFNRYALLALPPLLLSVAIALDGVVESARPRFGRAAFVPVGIGLALWLGAGPLARFQFRAGTFAHQNDFVEFGCPPASLAPSKLPTVYSRLAADGAVLEAPWHPTWRFSRSLHAYQEHHLREVRVIHRDPALTPPVVRLASVLPADEAEWLASDARYLVVHLDLASEEERLEVASCAHRSGAMPEGVRRRLVAQGATLSARASRQWGPPDWSSEGLLVWDLERVRRTRR